MRRAVMGSILAGAVAGGCGASARGVAGATRAAAQDTVAAFAGTMGPVRRPPGRFPTPALLRAVSAVRNTGFDRLVFEFSGDSLPGYEVRYVSGPIRACGSGDPVSLAGSGRLLVRLVQAQAHDSLGRVTLDRRESTPGLPIVRELKLACDFEGQIEWAVGLAAPRRYRVLEATEPPRVIVDVRHHD